MAKRFVLIRDDLDGALVYFIRIGLGIFWECGPKSDEAKKFSTRAAAVKILHATGKHREGWRVLAEQG